MNDPRWKDWIRLESSFGHVESTEDTKFESYPPHTLVGMRLDRYLAIRFHYFTRPQWKELVLASKVIVNGHPERKPTYKVQFNDHVTFYGSGLKEPPIPKKYDIVYEDEHVLAINKPPHIPVHQCGRYLKNTLLQLLKERYPDVRACHRLDVETSGVLLCSKDLETHHFLNRQFEENRMRKIYLAMVFGIPLEQCWTNSASLGICNDSKIAIKSWVNPRGLTAETEFQVLHSSPRRKYSLLEARPRTGRTNQIRIHAAHSGFPLVGDKQYFPNEDVFLEFYDYGYSPRVHEAVKFHRCMLHARALTFEHPYNGMMTAEAPPPADYKLCFEDLTGEMFPTLESHKLPQHSGRQAQSQGYVFHETSPSA